MNKALRKNLVSAIITVMILALGFTIFRSLSAQKKSTVSDAVVKKERRTVKVSYFSPEAQPNEIEIDGRVRAHERVNLTSKVQGVMQESGKSIKEGQYYKKGDLLFSIDSQEATYTLKAQKSTLMTAITQMMPDLKFDHPKSFDGWLNYLNQFDVDQPIAPLPKPMSDQEKYYVTGKNIYSQFYTIKSQETRLGEYNIYAPFSGVITAINVFPGALISPNQVLATMINTGQFEIAAPVPLVDLKHITVGQSVELSSSDLYKSWKGKVSRIGTQIDATTQNIPIYIGVYGRGLKDGMYLKGKLNGKQLEEVTKLPKDIFLSSDEVYVVIDSTLTAKEITPIKRLSDHILVKGLSPDEMVVTGSLAGLFEGQKVSY
ncbi:MAG: HlyD family efflux transporter periplasmic adaptor subunit [Bacteroidota bacterium]